jgi:hypothetical protein
MAADSINHLNVESDVQGCAALRAGVATVPIGAACREYPSRTNPQRSSRPPTSSRPVGIARNSGQPGLHMAVAPLNRMSLVKAMWSASGNADEAVLPGVIVPDSHVEFVFHLADPWRMRCANEPGWRSAALGLRSCAKDRWVLVAESLENVPRGWKARYVFTRKSDDEYHEMLELDPDGKGFQPYVTNRFLRLLP